MRVPPRPLLPALLALVATCLAFAPVTDDGKDTSIELELAHGLAVDGEEVPEGCADDRAAAASVALDVDGEEARGAIGFPAAAPDHLVVFAHGYGRWSAAWRPHIERVTAELGVVAVAMDYRGTVLPPDGGTTGARGWQVREGAADSIAVAQALLLACPSIDQVTLFSVSMGSNAAGLALAQQPVRADGTTPLFDWWLNLEGAVASHETYLAARALAASGNQLAVEVTQDIERQNGGPIEEQPAAYREMSVVSHAEAIATSGVQGVLHVHGLEDGLVPYDQARELSEQLRVHGLPQEFVTLLRRDPDNAPDQQNDNLTNYVVRPVDPAYDSPFAGHGDERFADNDVMATGFARLGDLVGGLPISACAEVVLDAGEAYAAPAC